MNVEHANSYTALFLFISFCVVLYFRKFNQNITVRHIAAIEMISYGVARAAEAGKSIIFTTGISTLGPVFFACLTLLKGILQKAKQLHVPVILPQNSPECVAYLESFLEQNEFHDSSPAPSVQFLSEDQFAFASGYMGLVHRHQTETAFLFGQFAGESLILSEAGRQVNAFQIAGSVSPEQVPFFICTCDYTLIGEELFAAGAYLSGDSSDLGNLRSQDILKLLLMLIIVVGIIWTYFSKYFL
jgi:hypothetical protein